MVSSHDIHHEFYFRIKHNLHLLRPPFQDPLPEEEPNGIGIDFDIMIKLEAQTDALSRPACTMTNGD